MSTQVPTSFVTEYRNNMKLSLQQKTSKLMMAVTSDDVSGEKVDLNDFIGQVKPNYPNTRHGPTLYNDTPHDRRWLAIGPPATYADFVDKIDQLQAKIDLQGAYTKAGTATINRAYDDAIIGGIYGTAISGKNGTISTPFASSMVVPVNEGSAAPSRMSIAKLRAARKLLLKSFVDLDEEELYMVLTAEQDADLLAEVPATSSDFIKFGGRTSMQTGKLEGLLGFNFVPMELGNTNLANSSLTVDSSGYRKTPFWAKSGIFLGFWERMFSNVAMLPERNYSIQVYARTICAATRTEEGKVGYILNSEA